MFHVFEPLIWAAGLALVSATKPDIAWEVSSIVSETSIATSNGSLSLYGPVRVTPLATSSTAGILTFTTTAYLNLNASISFHVSNVVHETQFSVEGSNGSQYVAFNIPEPSEDLLVSIGLDDGSENRSSQTVVSTGLIIAKDEISGAWVAREVGDHADAVNRAIFVELETLATEETTIAEPIDDGLENEPGEQGPEDSETGEPNVPGDVEMETNECGRNYNLVPPAISDPVFPCPRPLTTTECFCGGDCQTNSPCQDPVPCAPVAPCKSWKLCRSPRDVSSTAERSGSSTSHNLKQLQDHRYNFSSSSNSSAITNTFIDSTIRFTDRNNRTAPVGQLINLLVVDVYTNGKKTGKLKSIGSTSTSGRIRFKYNLKAGQTLVGQKLYTFLATELFGVATRPNEPSGNFTFVATSYTLSTKEWRVPSEKKAAINVLYPRSPFNDALMLAETYQRVTRFYQRNIYPKPENLERVIVWFQADSSSFHAMPEKNHSSYIKLLPSDSVDPSVMAHEYGHFAHFLVQDKISTIGGAHGFCNQANSKELSFSEGYATAFGMASLANTTLLDSAFTYIDREPEWITNFDGTNIEEYNCEYESLLGIEGRVAAVLNDLVDGHRDNFLNSSGPLGFIGKDFEPKNTSYRFSLRRIFWDVMQQQPKDIEEYWTYLKSNLAREPVKQNKAWAVFEYNWAGADFAR